MLGTFYQHDQAASQLEAISTERLNTGYLVNPIAQYDKSISETRFTTTSSNSVGGVAWRITTNDGGNASAEEVVFTIHGIILQCDLPPIIRPFGKSTSPKHLQQRILLTGLGTPTFNQALDGLVRLDSLLRLNLRDTPKELAQNIGGHPTLGITNRYFTSKRMANEEEHIGFNDSIDPKGILEAFRGDTLVHTTENKVFYYRKQTHLSGDGLFSKTQPANIKNGDIVEVQFTATLIESKNRKISTKTNCITKLVLRSITLLDDTFSEVPISLAYNNNY
ncbi:hypothetical protein VNI00_013395 [Paramarasmius palmivorus]|uniref:Uncharacterized protein n=1 Tax=Paramarasmius palmivorus TaxID=297713 RepID=A0AAW0C149_9AGAR